MVTIKSISQKNDGVTKVEKLYSLIKLNFSESIEKEGKLANGSDYIIVNTDNLVFSILSHTGVMVYTRKIEDWIGNYPLLMISMNA